MSTNPGGRRRLSGTAIAAAVAVLTALVSLLFTLRPELAPDPRTHLGAQIESAAIDTEISRAEFYEVVEPDDAKQRRALEDAFLKRFVNVPDPSPAHIRAARESGVLDQQQGSIVYVDTQGRGLKNKNVTIYWFVYGATTGQREYGGGAGVATLTAPNDHFVVPTFVDAPSHCRRRIYVRLELRDENGSLLAIDTTKPFRSCRTSAPLR